MEHRILIIDPDPGYARKVSTVLLAEGYEVEMAEGITAAVQTLQGINVDCVIVDEDLPEMKGHDAIPILRALLPEAPFIMTAAQNTRVTESRIRRQDILFYHIKCFDLLEVSAAINDAFRRIGKTPVASRQGT